MAKAPVTIEENKKPIVSLADRKPLVSPVPPERPLTPPVSNIFDNVQIFDKSTIKFNREIYSRKFFNEAVNNEFEELLTKEETFSPTQFFQLYDSLFFDIPKIGKNSHASLINRSRDYIKGYNINDPKDTTIDNLNDRIAELEQELLLAAQSDPEHPFFRNGSLVAEEVNGERTGKFYYMDKGFKRQVNYTQAFYRTLLKVLGYETTDDYPQADKSMLAQIKTGPNLGAGNFEQNTFIREGELYVGDNIVDDTKEKQIQNLRNQVKSLKTTIEELRDQLNETSDGDIIYSSNNTEDELDDRADDRDPNDPFN